MTVFESIDRLARDTRKLFLNEDSTLEKLRQGLPAGTIIKVNLLAAAGLEVQKLKDVQVGEMLLALAITGYPAVDVSTAEGQEDIGLQLRALLKEAIADRLRQDPVLQDEEARRETHEPVPA